MIELSKNAYESHSEDDTYYLGKDVGSALKGGETIILNGELGVGKTVFVRGLATGLSITEPITSPTFTLMNCYEDGRLNLYHIDAYRLHGSLEAYESGITEYFGQRDSVCCIEWAQNIADALVGKIIKVSIKYSTKNENYREIKIEYNE